MTGETQGNRGQIEKQTKPFFVSVLAGQRQVDTLLGFDDLGNA